MIQIKKDSTCEKCSSGNDSGKIKQLGISSGTSFMLDFACANESLMLTGRASITTWNVYGDPKYQENILVGMFAFQIL